MNIAAVVIIITNTGNTVTDLSFEFDNEDEHNGKDFTKKNTKQNITE